MPGLELSVIMPVYNSAPYLRLAIDSILQQSFTAFEFIIINDGSTDESESIILSYNDPRIIYLKNETNRGLVYSLNYGIDNAKGELIARMDGDDIAFTERFARQVAYLNIQPNVSVVASVVELINETGQPLGFWKEDRENHSYEQIKEFMPANNCIAHPTVMGRAHIFKTFRYRQQQGQAEDYDLWLRLLASEEIIHKLQEVLLYHRILPSSFTRKRQQNVFYKLAYTKWKFVKEEWKSGNINSFVIRTTLFSLYDAVKGSGKALKNRINK